MAGNVFASESLMAYLPFLGEGSSWAKLIDPPVAKIYEQKYCNGYDKKKNKGQGDQKRTDDPCI